MKVLLDTDVLMDVALGREDFGPTSRQLVEHCQKSGHTAFVAWHTISNLFYLLRSARSAAFARSFLHDLVAFAEVAGGGRMEVRHALRLEMTDLEDGLQVVVALSVNAQVLVTRNLRHFRGTPVRISTPQELLAEIAR